jgi:AcrR family transcriptional regulator
VEPLTPERRREQTRRHLLDAAAIVFAREGFHGASLDEVAATAGFTKGAVYSNFKSKADLFLAVLDDRTEHQHELINAELEEGADHDLERIQRTTADLHWGDEWSALWLEFVLYARRNPEALGKLAESRRRQIEAAEDLIRGEYERRGAEPAYPVRVLALISTSLYTGMDMERLIDPDLVSEADEQQILAFLFDTIGVRE